MLPVLKTLDVDFHSPQAALAYLDERTFQRFTLPLNALRAQVGGTVRHTGAAPISQLQEVRLCDVALTHLDSLVGIPASYASHIEPQLHAHSLNELLERQIAAVTVVVELEKKDPEARHVAAVLPGARFGVDDGVILERMVSRGFGAVVSLHSGEMSVRFGEPTALEVLPGDELQVNGLLRNARWGLSRATQGPMLEVGVYLLRLICTNGAFARRALAESRLMAWATRKDIEIFLDRQFDRALSFGGTVLQEAVGVMAETIPSDEEREEIHKLIARFIGMKRTTELLTPAVSWWDHFNAVTSAANQARRPPPTPPAGGRADPGTLPRCSVSGRCQRRAPARRELSDKQSETDMSSVAGTAEFLASPPILCHKVLPTGGEDVGALNGYRHDLVRRILSIRFAAPCPARRAPCNSR